MPDVRRRSFLKGAAGLALAAAVVVLPGTTQRSSQDPRIRVVTTTGILADLTRRVAGDDAVVVSLVPDGGDPHTYEPTARQVRDIVYADLALSNYLMLEEQSLIRTIDANLAPGVEHLALAEEASTRGAEIIQLVENHALDTIWLGLRVSGAPEGSSRTDQVRMAMTGFEGPGDLHGYVTGTFGEPQQVFDSTDGAVARQDAIDLPMDAHTHMSWAFTAPGIYRMGVQSTYGGGIGNQIQLSGTVVFAVGINPEQATDNGARQVIDAGHADLTADLDEQRMALRVDTAEGPDMVGLDDLVIHVPPKALLPVPSDPAYRFIARPGTDVYQLPQAVLGKHVHGEIDPHLWQDVTNAQAYVEVIRDNLIRIDSAKAHNYRQRAAHTLREFDELHDYVQQSIESIPEAHRNLVTTHDAYGYLAHRYGMTVAGTVSPSPGQEPSIADLRRLSQTLVDLNVRSVFIEEGAGSEASSLRQAAEQAGVEIGPIWGDAFTPEVNTYPQMMRANADSLARGLGGTPLGDHDLATRRKNAQITS